MNVHQWDIVKIRVRPEDKDEHPAVVISREEWCRDERRLNLNVLYCTTLRPAQAAETCEVRLNGPDGLERATVANCEHVFSVPRGRITAVAGRVAPERRKQISRTVVLAFRLVLA